MTAQISGNQGRASTIGFAMPHHHELLYAGIDRAPHQDAYTVRLDWSRDGESLGIVTASVSGPTLRGLDYSGDDDFWSAVALCAADAVEDAVAHGEGRDEWRLEGFVVHINPGQAAALTRVDQFSGRFQRGDIVKVFEA